MYIPKKGTTAAGDVDPSFGTEGKVILDFPTATFFTVRGMALTQERTLLVVGVTASNEFIVGRLTENGEIDLTFGEQGTVRRRFGNSNAASDGRSVTVQKDGKILVVGEYDHANSNPYPAVTRLHPNGDLDRTFGVDGTFTFPPIVMPAFRPDSGLHDVRTAATTSNSSILLPDGKILIIGQSLNARGLLVRLTENGVLDKAFNGTGYTIVRYPGADTYVFSVAVTSQARIIVGGQIYQSEEGYRGLLAGYDSNGQLDTRFGENGYSMPNSAWSTRIDDVISGENNTLICVGTLGTQGKQVGMIFGVTEDGSPDPAFNNGNFTGTTIGQGCEWYSTAKEPSLGTIVATGITFEPRAEPPEVRIAVGRYLRTGEEDKGFGNGNGWVILEEGQEPRLILQADGKTLVCANANDNIRRLAFVTRLMN